MMLHDRMYMKLRIQERFPSVVEWLNLERTLVRLCLKSISGWMRRDKSKVQGRRYKRTHALSG